MAAGFLSVQKLPEREMISMSGKTSSILRMGMIRMIMEIIMTTYLLMANSVALLNMFIPMASPDLATNLTHIEINKINRIIKIKINKIIFPYFDPHFWCYLM